MPISERELVIALHHIPGIGPQKWSQIQSNLSDCLNLLSLPQAELAHLLGANGAQLLCDWLKHKSDNWLSQRLARLDRWLEQPNRALVTCIDTNYPRLLGETKGPLLLHLWGNAALLDLPQVAVVGSRKPTVAGRKATQLFCQALASGGFGITSGLALGIDGAAHEAALAVAGNTIAVLGSGLGQIYPAAHRQLAERIVANNGLLVSEFALDVKPEPGHFPRRNRIISGLSLGTLVVEAALKSGSLITARYALEQNREVFAIPGSIFSPVSEGCNWLIREGATLVYGPEQLAEQLGAHLGVYLNENPEVSACTPVDRAKISLLEALGGARLDFEDLLEVSNLSVAELQQLLAELELEGLLLSSELGYERCL